MKRGKDFLYIIALFSFLFVSFLLLPSNVKAEDATNEIIIDRFPSEELFHVENAKPGDYAYRSLVIQNNLDLDILYTMEVRNDGDQKLFDELLLQVNFLDEVVFDGKLKDYKGFTNYPLDAETEIDVGFELIFPAKLGNEFQNQITKFSLVFHAVADDDPGLVAGISTDVGSGGQGSGTSVKGVSTTEGSSLPKTATNMFAYLLIGGLLIATGGFIVYLNKREKDFAFNLHTLKTFIKFKE